MDWMIADLYEDTKDTFIMLKNEPKLIGIVIGHVCFVFMFNLTGMIITDYVNAMVRNVMEPLRMITIWITSVFLYYVVDESIGEKVGCKYAVALASTTLLYSVGGLSSAKLLYETYFVVFSF